MTNANEYKTQLNSGKYLQTFIHFLVSPWIEPETFRSQVGHSNHYFTAYKTYNNVQNGKVVQSELVFGL